jgi:HNH endonuclease
MRYIPAEVRRLVSQRATGRCEYCGLSQEGQEAAFHIDHIVPVVAGGQTTAENLALACVSCSLHKAARQTAIDPQTGEEVAIYNPRRERWSDHFRWEGVRLVGQTATGRATVAALDMNRPLILAIRQEEANLGRHPPPLSALVV